MTAAALAQTGQQHGVELSWTYSDPSIPTITFNLYRLNAACPTSGTSGFTKISSAAISAQSYFDAAPAASGTTLCYYLTAVGNGLESAPSPTAQAVFLPPPFPPGSAPNITVK